MEEIVMIVIKVVMHATNMPLMFKLVISTHVLSILDVKFKHLHLLWLLETFWVKIQFLKF